MKPESWAVVTNGKKFRLRHTDTGRWYTKTAYMPIIGSPYDTIAEWDYEEDARAVAKNNTWELV